MPQQTIVAGIQRIIVMPPTGRVEVIGVSQGPQGPPGPPGDERGGGFTFTQEATPVGNLQGQTWFNTATGESFIWYDGYWVEFAPGPPPQVAETYVHHQASPSTVWTIDHNLPYLPNVTVVDSAGTQIEGSVVYTSGTQVTVTFSAALAGKAYLS